VNWETVNHDAGSLFIQFQLSSGIKMLQNSWECKNVNLRSGDGAGSGLPKTARSHSICLSSPLQKLVLFCALASNKLQYVPK
jgi:hypothetical protein